MAKAATKKEKKSKPAVSVTARVKTKPNSDKPKSEKKAKKASSKRHSAFESLAKLADHPMIADLLAVGAVAAVAAITEQQSAKGRPASSKMVKSAGKAAAAAIGKKLLGEFGAIKDAAVSAARKA